MQSSSTEMEKHAQHARTAMIDSMYVYEIYLVVIHIQKRNSYDLAYFECFSLEVIISILYILI